MTYSPDDEILRLLPHSYREGHIWQSRAISPAVCVSTPAPGDHASTAFGNLPALWFTATQKVLFLQPHCYGRAFIQIAPYILYRKWAEWIVTTKLWLMDIKMPVAVRTEKQVLHWVIKDVKWDPIVTYLIADGDFCSCWCFIFCLCITASLTVTGSWFMVIWRNNWDKIGVSLSIGNFSRCWGWNVSMAFLSLTSFELPIYLYFIFKWT